MFSWLYVMINRRTVLCAYLIVCIQTVESKVWYEGERQSAGGTSQLPDPDVESSL